MNDDKTTPPPLKGIKVIELTHLIAGPYCGQLLAEEGAQVIKIEPPSGELARSRAPLREDAQGHTVSAHYGALNRGKQSIALDLKNPEGMNVMHGLLESADVLITNMRAAALERLGIHPETLQKRYPRLVIACISGFGMEDAGEYADRAGLALVAEAMTGATGLTRDHAGNPVWCGFALGDILAGMTAHAAILLALRNQERYGIGRILDLGLIECTLPMVSVALARVQIADASLSAFAGSNDFHGVPYGAFPASDGFINIGVNRDDFWRRLCVAMGRPELGTDERYATYVERAKRQDEVIAITETFTRAHTRAEITTKLNEADVPVAGVLSMSEVLNDAYLRQRGALQEVEDGLGGTLRLPADPSRFRTAQGVLSLPRLGEHRVAVLEKELGLPPAEIARLEAAGAFGAAKPSPASTAS
ncbi:CaiB/BaiF CoA transferase family protein [Cupriavidus necator]|uniref:CaiB/BaiF CoA transferase family protein n=1 Tax=Cupriavidus necator TaxID=106590 RepID=UPI0009B80569|nr:CoA transferase [Cupriavidus necator]